MRSPKRFVRLSIVCGLTRAFIAAAANAQPATAPAPEPLPTAIEEALIEYACAQLHPAGMVESDAYLHCRRNRLTYLRAEFGRDLRRLSATERKTIDTACSNLRASRGQDAYVQCLQAKLATLPGHGKAKAEAASGAAAPPVPSVTPPAAPPPAAPSASPVSPVTIGAAVAALIAAGAGVLLLKKRRKPASGACRTCGAALHAHGELCPNCRHEAAEALRRASTERAVQQDAKRRQADQERRQQQAREDEERRRELAATQAAAAAAARQQEDDAQRRREDDAWRQRQVDATAAPDDFNAHAALGVPPGASAADIEAAYYSARAKYDLDLVADLGNELQEHYKRKAAAAQRAYEALTAPRL